MPLSNITEDKGRRALGRPNGLHSGPTDVYMMVLPVCRDIASSVASFSSCVNTGRSRDKVVNVIVSHGVPDFKSIIAFSRCLSTFDNPSRRTVSHNEKGRSD